MGSGRFLDDRLKVVATVLFRLLGLLFLVGLLMVQARVYESTMVLPVMKFIMSVEAARYLLKLVGVNIGVMFPVKAVHMELLIGVLLKLQLGRVGSVRSSYIV